MMTTKNLNLKKDHYKPVKTVSVFNNNYIQYEIIGDKDISQIIYWYDQTIFKWYDK